MDHQLETDSLASASSFVSVLERSDRTRRSVQRLTRSWVEAALAATRGRVAGPRGAAAKLGIPRQTLDSKIAALGIDRNRYKTR